MQMPSGPGSIEGLGESFEANPNTGTSSHSVKIEVPPGVAGFAPQLALSYSSGGGNGELGLGWAITLPAVQRGTDRRLPKYDANDMFVLRAMGARGAEDLVQLDDGSYRFRIEGAFASGRQRDDGSWSFKNKSGVLHRFGTSESSQTSEGNDVFAWFLAEQVDTHGNSIKYEYEKDGGRPYLSRVVYNDFSDEVRNEVVFEYEDRDDATTSYLSGFSVTTARRLVAVRVVHGGEEQRRYELSYEMLAGTSHLTAVRLVGRDGETALPTLTFDYADFDPKAADLVQVASAPARAVGTTAEISDVNGDGLPDLIVMDASDPDGSYRWYENLDGLSFGAAQTMASSPSVWLSSTSVELADLDGDSITDVFARLSTATDGLRYYPGTIDSVFDSSVTVQGAANHTPGAADAKLVDLNHDRLTDILAINSSTGRMTIQYNQGAGTFSAAAEFPAVSETELLTFSGGLRLADMNGDSLQDLVTVRSESVRYWPSAGYGAFAPVVKVEGAPSLEDSELSSIQVRDLNGDGLSDVIVVGVTKVSYWLSESGTSLSERHDVTGMPESGPNTEVRVADMNANGTADIVWIDPTSDSPWTYLDVLPKGTPGLLTRIDNGLGKVTSIEYAGLGAMRAWARQTGLGWTKRCPMGQTVVDTIETDDSLGSVKKVEYRYTDGYFDAKAREFRGFGKVHMSELGDETQPTLLSAHEFLLGESEESEKGLPHRVTRQLESGAVFDEIETTYETRTLATAGTINVRFTLKRTEQRKVFELGDTPRVLLSEFDQDEFGNLILEANYGEVSGDDRSTGRDEKVIRRTFASNEELWVVDRLASERIEDFEGNRVAEKRTYYDGEEFEGLPSGQVERGDATREESWIEADRFADVRRSKYDAYGNAVALRDARGMQTDVGFDEAAHTYLVFETQHPSEDVELTWTATYDEGFGKIRSVTGPNGEKYEFGYDALGRVSAIVEPGDTLDLPTKAYEYVLAAPTSTIREDLREQSGGSGTIIKLAYFDGLGRTRAKLEEGAGRGEWVLSSAKLYGSRGKEYFTPYPASVPNADFPSLDGLPGTHVEFDALGRETEKTESDGATTRSEYVPLGRRVWDPNDSDESSEHYDTPTLFETDGLDRLISVTERQGTEELVTGTYAYDALGKLTSAIDAAGRERIYTYDGRSRRTSLSDPNAGRWSFEYSDGDDLLEREDPTKRRVRWTYDGVGRKRGEYQEVPGTDEIQTKAFHYDVAPKGRALENVLGQLTWVDDEAGAVYFSYTPRGFLMKQTRHFDDGGDYTTWAEYDAQNRRTKRGFPDNTYYETAYDPRGLVSAVGPFVDSVRWTPAGKLDSAELGNGVTEKREYDQRQRIQRLTATGPSGDKLRDLEIIYDAASLITGLEDHRKGIEPAFSLSGTFRYDDRYRLVTAEDALGTTSWVHDAMGNVLSVSSDHDADYLNVENTFGENGAGPDALTGFGEETWSYDEAGRVVADGSRKLIWDPAGRLARVESGEVVEEYVYGYDDKRVIKRTTVGGATDEVLYVDDDVEVREGRLVRYASLGSERLVRLDALKDGRNTAPTHSVWAWPPGDRGALLGVVGLLVAMVGAAWGRIGRLAPQFGVAFAVAAAIFGCSSDADNSAPRSITKVPTGAVFYTPNYQGTTVILTSAKGEVVEETSYEAYGGVRAHRGADTEPRGFVGNEVDAGVGLSDFHARPYRAEAGVFLATDPVGVFKSDSITAEPSKGWTYAYAAQSPITLSDPAGEEPVRDQAGTVSGYVGELNAERGGKSVGVAAANQLMSFANTKWIWPGALPKLVAVDRWGNGTNNRYVYTKKGGWIDMSHFMFYAGDALKGRASGDSQFKAYRNALDDGRAQEAADGPVSAYSYEDLPSDKFGAYFGAYVFDPNSKRTLGEQVSAYLTTLGATNATEAPNFKSLPANDDASYERGGSTVRNHTFEPMTPKE